MTEHCIDEVKKLVDSRIESWLVRRVKCGIKIKDLAKKAGLSNRTLTSILNFEKKNHTVSSINAIENALQRIEKARRV